MLDSIQYEFRFFYYSLLKLTRSRSQEPEPKLRHSGSGSSQKFRLLAAPSPQHWIPWGKWPMLCYLPPLRQPTELWWPSTEPKMSHNFPPQNDIKASLSRHSQLIPQASSRQIITSREGYYISSKLHLPQYGINHISVINWIRYIFHKQIHLISHFLKKSRVPPLSQ